MLTCRNITIWTPGFEEARKNLENYGITPEWASRISEDLKSQAELAPYWPGAFQRMRQDGLIEISFVKSRKIGQTTYVQLVGTQFSGRIEILVTIDGVSGDETELKKRALQKYTNVGRD